DAETYGTRQSTVQRAKTLSRAKDRTLRNKLKMAIIWQTRPHRLRQSLAERTEKNYGIWVDCLSRLANRTASLIKNLAGFEGLGVESDGNSRSESLSNVCQSKRC